MLLFSTSAVTMDCLLMLCPASAAPGDLDLSFDAGSGANREINAIAVQPDGKIIIGGSFSTVKGLVRNGIARLNADGSGDTGFNAGLRTPYLFGERSAESVALQSDGKVIIAGGYFSSVNGLSRTNIARLNVDGTLDESFDAGTGAADEFGQIGSTPLVAAQPDGKMIIAGYFTSVNGVSRTNIARLNSSGSLDTSFNPGNAAADTEVRAMALQPDGKVLFAGYNRIRRLNTNGSRDTSFNPSITGNPDAIALQPDGKMIIGGDISDVNGVVRSFLARVNANGSLDAGFNSNNGVWGAPVRSIAVQSDGKVFIGGNFVKVDGQERNGFARLNANGTLDSSFDPMLIHADYSVAVAPIAVQTNDNVLIAGRFNTVNGTSRYGIARLRPDGSLDASFNAGSGPDNPVYAVATQPDGKVLVGGSFAGVQGVIRSRIARLNANGGVDTNFDSQLIPYPSIPNDAANRRAATVHAIALQLNGKILVGSTSLNYMLYGGSDPNGYWTSDVARLNADGSLDSNFNPVHGVNIAFGRICVALQSDGKAIIGGTFRSLNGVDINRMARINDDGSLDFSFNVEIMPPYSWVESIALQPDGKMLIGGYAFTTVNGISRNRIARLNDDGSLDFGFDPGTGVGGTVGSLALQPDGKVLIGGSFTTVNGASRNGIARLNADGSLDGGFDPTILYQSYPGTVHSMAIQDGKVLVAGSFTAVNGVNRPNLARLNADGTLDTIFNPGNEADGELTAIALQPDGRLLIGGSFGSVNGVARNYVARHYGGDSPILSFQKLNNELVLNWTNAGFTLQTAPALIGPFTNLPAATSPFTNPLTAPQQFFRLTAP